MKTKSYLIIAAAIVLLIISNIYFYNQWRFQKDEATRHKDNYDIVTSDITYHRTKDSLLYAEIGLIKLSTKELTDSLKKQLSDLEVKIKQVKYITVTNTETEKHFETFFRDSTIADTIPIEYFDYKSKWIDLRVTKSLFDDSADIQYKSRDSIAIAIVTEKKGFLFWRKKTDKVKIKSYNPDSKITHNESYQVDKTERRWWEIF